jgi:hypothetical protein
MDNGLWTWRLDLLNRTRRTHLPCRRRGWCRPSFPSFVMRSWAPRAAESRDLAQSPRPRSGRGTDGMQATKPKHVSAASIASCATAMCPGLDTGWTKRNLERAMGFEPTTPTLASVSSSCLTSTLHYATIWSGTVLCTFPSSLVTPASCAPQRSAMNCDEKRATRETATVM